MGLDITAYSIPADSRDAVGIHYWRKHYMLKDWCEALHIEQGGAAWDDDAHSIRLTSDDLYKLEADVLSGDLPDCLGRDEALFRAHDLEFIAKARVALAAGSFVEIVFS